MATDAVYLDRLGVSRAVRVMRRRPDPVTEWNGGQWIADVDLLEVRVAEAPDLTKGETFFLGGEILAVADAPRSDADRLVWTVQVAAS